MPTIVHEVLKVDFPITIKKAHKDSHGKLHVVGVASDTKKDYHGERFTRKALDMMVSAVKSGNVLLLPTHWDTFEIGKGYDAWISETEELHVDLMLDEAYTQAQKLWDEVQRGRSDKQMSVGGSVSFADDDAYWWEDDCCVLNNMQLDHIAVTRGGHAANDRTGFAEAVVKGLQDSGMNLDHSKTKASMASHESRVATTKGLPLDQAGYGKADISQVWDFSKEEQDGVIAAGGYDLFKRAHAWFDETKGAVPADKDAYKLPHHKMVNGKFAVVLRGVMVQAAVLLGTRIGDAIPDAERKSSYQHLANHYADFGMEAPAFKSYSKNEFVKFHQDILKTIPETLKFNEQIAQYFKDGEHDNMGDTTNKSTNNPEKSQTTATSSAPASAPAAAVNAPGDQAEKSQSSQPVAANPDQATSAAPATEIPSAPAEKNQTPAPENIADFMKSLMGKITQTLSQQKSDDAASNKSRENGAKIIKGIQDIVATYGEGASFDDQQKLGDLVLFMITMMMQSMLSDIDLTTIPVKVRNFIFGMGYLAGSLGSSDMVAQFMGMLNGGTDPNANKNKSSDVPTQDPAVVPPAAQPSQTANDATKTNNGNETTEQMVARLAKQVLDEVNKTPASALKGADMTQLTERIKRLEDLARRGTQKGLDGQEESPEQRGNATKDVFSGLFSHLR
jgi:hypothetical protein